MNLKVKFFLSAFILTVFFTLSRQNTLAVGKPVEVGNERSREVKLLRADNKSATANQGRKNSCLAKEKSINKRSEQLVKMSKNMLDKFSQIKLRVEEFYTSKVTVKGNSVPDYATLEKEIDTKKTAVETDLESAKTNAASFSCNDSEPQVQLTKFKDEMLDVKLALKDYRTSIKNLIVAVHSANSSDDSSEEK